MPGLVPKLRGGLYYAIGSVAGRRIRKGLGTRDEARAQELCALLEAKYWKRHSYGEEAVVTFDEAALSYMNEGGEKRYLPPLIKRFRGRVLGTIKPGEITGAAFALYPDAKPSTRNRQAIIPMRAVMTHASAKGWCPLLKVKNFDVAKVLRRSVDRAWIDAFMAQADGDGLPHLSAAMLFMFQNGARISEAAHLLPEHVDTANQIALLAETKTGEWEACYLTDELTARIVALPQELGEPLFGYQSRYGIRRRCIAVCRRAGISFIPNHQAGRHSFVTNALNFGASPKAVADAGRYKSMRMMLEVYAHAENAGREVASLFDTNRAQSKPKLRQVIGKKGGRRA